MKENLQKLKEYFQKLKDWHGRLNTRERQAVTFGGAALALFLIYQITLAPLYNSVTSMRTRIVANEKTLSWMKVANAEITKKKGQTNADNHAVTPVVLLGILQKQIKQNELEQYVSELKQVSNENIELHLKQVEFDKMMQLLLQVQKEQKIMIVQMSAIADKKAGIVNADVILKIG